MPNATEDLLLDGLLDKLEEVGLLDHLIGFTRKNSFIEGDKIACKHLCHEYNIPVADKWYAVDARNYEKILRTCLVLLGLYGGAVLKYPFSAGGKGSRIILNSWEIKEVYDTLINDYGKSLEKKNMLRPCLIYPGCFLSFDNNMAPTRIRVCEINIRPAEPEWQPGDIL